MNEYRPVEQNGVLGRLKRELERRRRWSGGRIAVLVAGLLVLAGALWLVFLQGGKPDAYTTVPARRGPLIVTVSATGSLQPETQVNVGAEVSGRIDAVNVDFNDHVTKDQVLAVINTDQLRALLAQAKAALNAA